MATSLLTLLDDVATLLDDVSVMTKVAAKKTAGVLGDDLALNANQVAGVKADRELPVVWAVAKGSALNKVILVPVALLISVVAPWAINPLLMLGGLYLCYEGVEKIAHRFLHPEKADADKRKLRERAADPGVDVREVERDKVKGAIRTDFILSGEIIVIALGSAAGASLPAQFAVLVAVSAMMTVGVYGIVAGIVKLDDLGLHMVGASSPESLAADGALEPRSDLSRSIGRGILWFAPVLMKVLSVVGTAAMFIVGGGILTHGVHQLSVWIESASSSVAALLPSVDTLLSGVTKVMLDSLVGIVAGAVALGVVTLVQRLRGGDGDTVAADEPAAPGQ